MIVYACLGAEMHITAYTVTANTYKNVQTELYVHVCTLLQNRILPYNYILHDTARTYYHIIKNDVHTKIMNPHIYVRMVVVKTSIDAYSLHIYTRDVV